MDTEKDSSLKNLKSSLMNKYRDMFVEKLTRHDLEELQSCLKKQYDRDHGWNHEYRVKFELKLRRYFHEEVLKREITSIETLLSLMVPQDLER